MDNSASYTLTPENYVLRNNALNRCEFKLMSLTFPSGMTPVWIMGLTFMHNYYTIFDPQTLRVGFAESIFKQSIIDKIRIKDLTIATPA